MKLIIITSCISILVVSILFIIVFWQDIQSRRSISKYLNSRVELEPPNKVYIIKDQPRQIVKDNKREKLELEKELRQKLYREELQKKLLEKKGVKL